MSLQRGARLYLRRGLGGGARLWPPCQGPGPCHPHPIFISVVPSGVSAMATPVSLPALLCESERERPSPRGVFLGWMERVHVLPALPAPCQPWSPGNGAGALGPLHGDRCWPGSLRGQGGRRLEEGGFASGSWEDANETPARLRTLLPTRSGRCRQRGGPGHHRPGQRIPEWEPVPAVAWGQWCPCPHYGSPPLAHGRRGPPRPLGCPGPWGAGVGLPRAAHSTCPGHHLPVASLVWSVTLVAKPASVLSFI